MNTKGFKQMLIGEKIWRRSAPADLRRRRQPSGWSAVRCRQKGSSAMPHKRNPIGSENMTGLARVIRGHMVTAYENVSLWHERDISHSSAERIITPDTTILIDYMLNRFGNIVKNLTVFPENMIRNMNSTFGLIYIPPVLCSLFNAFLASQKAS